MCSDGVCTFQNGCGCFEAIARALMERDRAATERERERCANVVNTIGPFDLLDFDARETIAAAIRQP
jgi:hypothetical protein